MAVDFVVPPSKEVDLDQGAPSGAFRLVEIVTLSDLVKEELVGSKNDLQLMVKSAQDATKAAMNERGPLPPVPGTLARVDLGRFSRFSLGAAAVHPGQASLFWNVARRLSPLALVKGVGLNTDIRSLGGRTQVRVFKLKDITIGENGTLVVSKAFLRCNDLVIKKAGKLKTKGSVYIKANSVLGVQ